MISASGTEAYVKNILYNEHGQRTEIDYGNNVVTKYAYDEENLRLKTIETTKGGRTIQSLTYDYDDTGNVTRRSNDGFQTKDDNRKFAEHNYEYDSLNRLVKAKGSYTRSGLIIDNMLQKYDTKYDYTPGGNISRKKQSAWGVGTEGNSITDVNLSYDNEYKYDSPKPHAVTKVGSTEYTYDLDGRMTGSYDSESKFKRTFTWDEEGRLLKTVDNKHTTDYRYDANGERICKYSDLGETIYASGYYTETDGKKISKHIYIGSTRVASQVMSRSCETSTTMKRENTLYYHTDHLGSSGYVTDKKGEFYEHTEYTSSGESWVNEKVTGNANLPYKYTSKEQDAETGLYYYGARYYDARTSRWISTDPILEEYMPVAGNSDEARRQNRRLPGMGGVYNPTNMNLYHYAGNNPVKYIDPDGKQSACAAWSGTMWWLLAVDGPIPVGDIIYVAGVAGTGCFDLWVRFGPVLMANADKIPAVVDKTQNTINSISNSSSNMPDPNKLKDVISGVRSLINQDKGLINAAEEMGKNQRVQQEANDLVQQFLNGNKNPGIGSKNLFKDINYLRGRNGARIFYRIQNGVMEILAKADKGNVSLLKN
mgnify:CR=1 FL=1